LYSSLFCIGCVLCRRFFLHYIVSLLFHSPTFLLRVKRRLKAAMVELFVDRWGSKILTQFLSITTEIQTILCICKQQTKQLRCKILPVSYGITQLYYFLYVTTSTIVLSVFFSFFLLFFFLKKNENWATDSLLTDVTKKWLNGTTTFQA
jgi:hypothetical protein